MLQSVYTEQCLPEEISFHWYLCAIVFVLMAQREWNIALEHFLSKLNDERCQTD